MDKRAKLQAILDAPDVVAAPPVRHDYIPEDKRGDPRGAFQKYPALYALVHDLINPTLAYDSWKQFLPDPARSVVVNLGCGCRPLHREMINVDMVSFPVVDLVADFSGRLPIRTSSVDGVVSVAVLEHLTDARVHVAEMARILKPGGLVYVAAPFMYPFHAAPADYTRWTQEGLKRVFADSFEVVASGNRGGVAGVIIVVLSHLVGQLLSFGSYRAYAVASTLAMAALSPLKLLDLVLGRLPFSATLCLNIYVVARRTADA